MKVGVFWNGAPRSMVEVYRRFRSVCCHNQEGSEHAEDSHRLTTLLLRLRLIDCLLLLVSLRSPESVKSSRQRWCEGFRTKFERISLLNHIFYEAHYDRRSIIRMRYF